MYTDRASVTSSTLPSKYSTTRLRFDYTTARGGAFRCDTHTARRRERTMRTEPCSPARKVSTDRGIQNRCLTLCDRHRCPPDPLSLRPGALVLVCAGGDQRLAHACRGARGRPGQIWMCSSVRIHSHRQCRPISTGHSLHAVRVSASVPAFVRRAALFQRPRDDCCMSLHSLTSTARV